MQTAHYSLIMCKHGSIDEPAMSASLIQKW